MEGLHPLITDLAIILIVAGATTFAFKKMNQPVVLGYLVAGFLTGPNFPLFFNITDAKGVKLWSEIGVIFLMFAIGLEFSFAKLKKVGSTAFIALTFLVTGMGLLGYGAGILLGWNNMDSLFLGSMISMSSTAIIIKAFEDLGLKGKSFTDVCMGIIIVEDIWGIILLVIISTLGQSQGSFDPDALLLSIGKLIVFLSFSFVFGIWLLPSLFKKMSKHLTEETLLIVSLGLCLGMTWLAVSLELSSALGAFLMGSLLAETDSAHKIEEVLQPVKNLFTAVFFVSVGMMVDPKILVQYLVPVVCIVVVVIFGKIIFASLGVITSGHNLKTAMLCAFSLTQIGEFSFIVAEQGQHFEMTSSFLYPIIVAVSVITTFTTPTCVKIAPKVYEKVVKLLPDLAKEFLNRYTDQDDDKPQNDSTWHDFWVNYLLRLFIYLVIILGVNLLIYLYVVPPVQKYLGDLGMWLAGFGTILLLAPVYGTMLKFSGHLRDQYYTLFFQKKSYRLPLLAARGLRIYLVFLSIFEVFSAVTPMNHYLAFFITVCCCVYIVLQDDFLIRNFKSLEARFLVNLNQKHIEITQEGSKIFPFDEDFHTVLYEIKKGSLLAGKTLFESSFKQKYGCNILRIQKKDGIIYDNPERDLILEAGDVLRIVGDTQQYAFFNAANKDDRLGLGLQQEPVSLKEYMLNSKRNEDPFFTVLVFPEDNFPAIGQTIGQSNIKNEFNCWVIGLQRGNYTFSNPTIDMEIEKGDALWLLGKQDMCSKLMQEGLL